MYTDKHNEYSNPNKVSPIFKQYLDIHFNVLEKVKVLDTPKSKSLIKIIKSEGEISQLKLLSNKFGNIGGQLKFDGYRKKILSTKGITEIQISKKKGSRSGKKYEWKSIYKYEPK